MAKNYAGMSTSQLAGEITGANAATLKAIKEAIKPLGFSPKGQTMQRIENREAELAGKEPPHTLKKSDLPPITGNQKK